MFMSVTSSLLRLPAIPRHYMRAAEQRQVREMTGPTGRPGIDHRSAERIIEQSAVTRRFLESRDNYEVTDEFKLRVGDWTDANPDPKSRSDAAYHLDKVLRFIDNLDDRALKQSQSRNGHIDGFSNDGYGITADSEASVLKAFSQRGYEALRYLPS